MHPHRNTINKTPLTDIRFAHFVKKISVECRTLINTGEAIRYAFNKKNPKLLNILDITVESSFRR
jgi:hypothetical protein